MGVTTVGREEAVLLNGYNLSGLEISAINIGTDGTAFSASDTALLSEQDFIGNLSATASGTTMTIQAVFENNNATIREAGMVCQNDPTNASQSSKTVDDVQFSRRSVPEVNLQSTDKLDVTFELTVENNST